MENNIQTNVPKKKKMNDFLKLFLAIGGLITALLLLKLAMQSMHLM